MVPDIGNGGWGFRVVYRYMQKSVVCLKHLVIEKEFHTLCYFPVFFNRYDICEKSELNYRSVSSK